MLFHKLAFPTIFQFFASFRIIPIYLKSSWWKYSIEKYELYILWNCQAKVQVQSQVQKSSPKSSPKVKSKVLSLKSFVKGLGLCLLYYHYTTTTHHHHHPKLFNHFHKSYPQVLYFFGNLSWPLTWIQTQMQKICKFVCNHMLQLKHKDLKSIQVNWGLRLTMLTHV